MRPRERVLTSLNHKEPDKVPLDLGSTITTTLTRIAYNNLRSYLNMKEDTTPCISHRQMDTVYPKEDLLNFYQVDFRPVYLKSPWGFKAKEMPDDSFYDEFGIRWKKAAYYYDAVERPLTRAETIADLNKFSWPDPYDPGRVEGLKEMAKQLYQRTDYVIVADIMCGGPFEQAQMMRGYEQFLIDLYWNRAFAEALLDKITDIDIRFWEVYLDAVGDYVQVVAQGDDVAMQTGTYIHPKMYRKFIKPRHKRLFDFIKSRTKAKIFYHSCGSVYDIIPDLIEVGIDILNPIQRSASRMDILKLKKEFGKDITFWGGGIDVQKVLPFASLQQIEDEVRRTIEIMAPGGGFVFFPSHNIQPDVTPDRVHKVFESALKYRDY